MRINGSRPVTHHTAPKAQPFGAFLPTNIAMYRDGGTIKLDGELNKSVSASVRFDGALGSKTRGKFFVTEHHFLQPAGKERPMTKPELKSLKAAVEKHLANARITADSPYRILLQDLDKALAPAKPSSK